MQKTSLTASNPVLLCNTDNNEMPRSDEAQAFFYAVYQAVQEIPPGKVTSYGHIAMLVGTRTLKSVNQSSPPPPTPTPLLSSPPTFLASHPPRVSVFLAFSKRTTGS